MTASNTTGGIPTGIKAALIVAAFLGVLFAAYASFCAWVGEESQVPLNTYVSIPGVEEPVDIGGTTYNTAVQRLEQTIAANQSNITVTCGEHSIVFTADYFKTNHSALLKQLAVNSQSQPFLSRGVSYLLSKNSNGSTTYDLTYTWDSISSADRLLNELAELCNTDAVDTSYTMDDTSVYVTIGVDGSKLNTYTARDVIEAALQQGESQVFITPEPVAYRALSADDVNALIYVAPVPVQKNANGETIPPTVGRSIDVTTAEAILAAAQTGETVEIPLVFTQPDYTQAGQEGLLYQDLLSQCKTSISGSSNRLSNITLAAEKCNGTILLPGDTFDYNAVVGQRTAEAGFKSAPAYYMGQTVNEIGGGICQVSSSLYYCAVYANLKIVSRSNHRYAVGYVPDGLDATVSWGGPEFRFQNNTNYPIKIVTFVEGRNLTIQFYGTNADGIYVETERNRLSTTNYTTNYQPDESIPRGTTKVSVTPYTGRKTEVYRCVYASDGTLISRTLENVSNYSARDQVILYNPADAESLGLAPSSSTPAESQPVESQPVESQPVESQPVESQPVESQPVESQPVESQPVESQPVESQPVESQPVESQPVESQPVESQPEFEQSAI